MQYFVLIPYTRLRAIPYRNKVADLIHGFAVRLLTNPYSKKRYVKVHNNSQTTVFTLAKRGAGAKPLQKKDDVILRARPQTILRPKDLVPPQFTRAARCLYEEI